MNATFTKILVSSSLLVIGVMGKCGVDWLASASDSHETTTENKTEITEMEALVKSNTAVLEKLAERQLEKDAAHEATVNLCKAGDISKCSVCRGVGVYDAPACEK